ncbi:MAG: N-acetylmuramoyl-L-alanine amidase [Oscillospiraceae bacterium]
MSNIKAPEVISNEIETTAPQVQSAALKIDNPAETTITVDSPVITFTGFCDRLLMLTIDGEEISKGEDGSFSYNVNLSIGENKVHITDTVTTLEYTIFYKPSMIKSVSPSGTLKAKGESQVVIKVLAIKDANLTAQIGKTKVDLALEKKGKSEKNGEVEYVTYSGEFTVPKATYSKQDLGKIKITGIKGEENQVAYGAKIIIEALKLENVIIPTDKKDVSEPQISGNGTVSLLSPFDDHGLGKANICTVSKKYAETWPSTIDDDNSDPRHTPLLAETVDYIVGSSMHDNMEFLSLKSGKKMKADEQSTKIGYIMPPNGVSIYKSYTEKNTNIIFTTNWKVPFNLEMKNQDYYKGYAGMVFNCVKSTTQYIDLTFSYTVVAKGEVDFSGSNVLKSAEWIDDGNNSTSTLRIYLKDTGKFYGYKAYYSSDNRLVISIKNKPASHRGATVMILAGHGGKDCGAIAVNGVYESNLNLLIAQKVRAYLEEQGVNVKMMRTDDRYVNLDDYIMSVRNSKADAFITIHSNSSTAKSRSGVETYYYRNYSKPFADKVQSRMISAWQEIYKGNEAMQSKVDGATRYYPFRAIRVEECPAMLVECGYLSNNTECEMLCTPVNQDKIATAIGMGIVDYLDS